MPRDKPPHQKPPDGRRWGVRRLAGVGGNPVAAPFLLLDMTLQGCGIM